jgi:hypothetical protein
VYLKVEILVEVLYVGGSKPFAYKGDVLTLSRVLAQTLVEKGLARPYKKNKEE